jgi:hypothetical protein
MLADASRHLRKSSATLEIAERAERWSQDYLQAKDHAERTLEKIEIAIETI